jgi:methionine aminotransferase
MSAPLTGSSKLPGIGTTIFTTMTALAREANAVNLSQGFPDFDPHPSLTKAIADAAMQGLHHYAPMEGLLSLRELWAERMYSLYAAKLHPESEITVTAGATQAIFTAVMAVVKPGDEVILFSPAYDCYEPAVILAGGRAVHCELSPPYFKPDWTEVGKLINPRTRMIIINNPHNPTATVWSADDMMQLEELVKKSDILILSDEVYDKIVFDGLEHFSVLSFPLLAERSYCVFSFGKTYHTTGWKTGMVCAPSQLMKEFRKVHQFNVFSVNILSQIAFASVLKSGEADQDLAQFFARKRDYFASGLQGSRWNILPSSGTYFMLAGFQKISDEKDTDFALRMIKEAGVAAIPVSVFYHNHTDHSLIRFCFGKKEETLNRAIERLMKWK